MNSKQIRFYALVIAALLYAGCTLEPNIESLRPKLAPEPPKVTLTYHANGVSGAVPAVQRVSPGASVPVADPGGLSLAARKHFGGWNTALNGSGMTYTAGSPVTVMRTLLFTPNGPTRSTR